MSDMAGAAARVAVEAAGAAEIQSDATIVAPLVFASKVGNSLSTSSDCPPKFSHISISSYAFDVMRAI